MIKNIIISLLVPCIYGFNLKNHNILRNLNTNLVKKNKNIETEYYNFDSEYISTKKRRPYYIIPSVLIKRNT